MAPDMAAVAGMAMLAAGMEAAVIRAALAGMALVLLDASGGWHGGGGNWNGAGWHGGGGGWHHGGHGGGWGIGPAIGLGLGLGLLGGALATAPYYSGYDYGYGYAGRRIPADSEIVEQRHAAIERFRFTGGDDEEFGLGCGFRTAEHRGGDE